MNGPSKSRFTPQRAPAPVRAKPNPPEARAPARKLTAPQRPPRLVVARTESNGGGAFWVGMLLVAGVAIYFWWNGAGSAQTKELDAPLVVDPKPNPVEPVPAPVVEPARAVARTDPMPMPMTRAPMPA